MATSVISAVFDLYNSIDASHFGGTRPPMRLTSMSTTTAAGAQQRVPFCVLRDQGFRPEYNSSTGGIENGQLILEVYAVPLGANAGVSVDSIVQAIKFAGQEPKDKAGFDWGTLTTLTGFNYSISMRRTFEQRAYAGFNYDSQPVHMCTLKYDLIAGLKSTA